MNISPAGIDLIKSFEACRLTAYKDVKGINTIGFGHVISSVSDMTSCTSTEADGYLIDDLQLVVKAINRLVAITLTQNQFNALCSFTFNVGITAFEHSTLLKFLNGSNVYAAALEFSKWDHAGGNIIPGLLRRRIAERDLFLTI